MTRRENIAARFFPIIPFFALFLALTGSNPAYAYNWPWDQGHDVVTAEDGDENWDDEDGGQEPQMCCQEGCGTACDVYVSSGQVNETYIDLNIPGIGPALQISRTYNSQDWSSSLLGHGWTFNFGRKLIITRTNEGEKQIGVLLKNGEKNFYKELSDGTLERITIYGATYHLIKNTDKTYTILENKGSSYELREDGKISRILDKNLNALTFTYNSVGCLSRITNASGNYVDFTLGPNGKIASISDNLGRTISYGYNENGNLISVTDPMGYVSQYVYNSENLLSQAIDKRGNVIETITYDNNQPPRVSAFTEKGEFYTMVYFDGYTQKTDSQGNRWTYYYNDAGTIDRIIDPLGHEKKQFHNQITSTSLDWEEDLNGNRTTYTYDEYGNKTSKTDSLGNTWSYTFIAGTDLVTSETNPSGVVTLYEYDANGNLSKLIKDLGGSLENQTNYTYDSRGRQTSLTDPLGHTTSYEYDASGNLIKITDPLGNVRIFTYDAYGNKLTETDPKGYTNTYSYDLLGSMASAADALGHTTIYIYDANGNQVKVQLPNGEEITFEYDAYNRLIKSSDPLGNNQTYAYDHNDKLISQTDANGNTTQYGFDVLGRRISVIDAKSHQTTYGYDAVGNMVTVTDANGNTTTFTYDTLNRQTQKTYPDGTNYTYTYDALNRKTSQTDPNGNTITYAYDSLNRMVQTQYSDGASAYFTYDVMGRMLTGFNSDSSLGYTYDVLGRVVSSAQDGKTVVYSYDAAGNLVSMTTPEGEVVQYAYNNANFMTQMQLLSGKGIGYTYDSLGRVVGKDYTGGINATWSFDQAGRLTNINYSKSDGTSIYSQANTFDAVVNILQKTTGAGDTSYTYDNVYQLTGVDHPAINDELFTYDSVGNRLTSADHTDWTYNNLNELGSYDGVTYTYDPNGNTISKTDATGTTSYQYNYENRMIRADFPGGSYATYKYDIMGRRIEKSVDGVVSKYLYAGGNTLLAEYDVSGSLQRNYFNGTGDINPSILAEGGQIYFYVKDHLDTPQKVVNESGDVEWSADYKSFGEVSVTVHTVENNFRFPGQYLDQETGLNYNFYRYYDPESGRYLRTDPIGFAGGGINLYAYVGNSPIYRVDPFGLVACSWAVGRCTRNVAGITVPDTITIEGITFTIPQWVKYAVNAAVPDHHDVRVESYSGDCSGTVEESITRGFFANSFNDAIKMYAVSLIPFSGQSGNVSGSVQDSAATSGPCSMSCVSQDRFDTVKTRITTSTATSYNLGGYNCQNWANDMLAL